MMSARIVCSSTAHRATIADSGVEEFRPWFCNSTCGHQLTMAENFFMDLLLHWLILHQSVVGMPCIVTYVYGVRYEM
jgi:hypothetical protein